MFGPSLRLDFFIMVQSAPLRPNDVGLNKSKLVLRVGKERHSKLKK